MDTTEFVKQLGDTLEKMELAESPEYNGKYVEVVCMECKWQGDSKKLIRHEPKEGLHCPECNGLKIYDLWRYERKDIGKAK